MFTLNEEYKVLNLLGSTLISADLNGVGIDVERFSNELVVVATTGLITSTGATYVINIQGSTTVNGTYSTIGSFASLSGTAFSYTLAELALDIKDTGANKFVRAFVDTTANAGTVAGVIGLVAFARPFLAEQNLNSSTFA